MNEYASPSEMIQRGPTQKDINEMDEDAENDTPEDN